MRVGQFYWFTTAFNNRGNQTDVQTGLSGRRKERLYLVLSKEYKESGYGRNWLKCILVVRCEVECGSFSGGPELLS